MSFRGRGRSPGGGRGRFDRGGRGGRFSGRGGRGSYDQGPPESVVEAGTFSHECEGEAVCNLTNSKIPYFNAPIFLENKSQVGKVEEVFGKTCDVMFTVKMSEGILAKSYSSGAKFYIDPFKLLPFERFLPQPKGAPGSGGRGGRGGGRGGPRGGRGGGFRGGGGRGFGGGGRFGSRGGGRSFGGGGRSPWRGRGR